MFGMIVIKIKIIYNFFSELNLIPTLYLGYVLGKV